MLTTVKNDLQRATPESQGVASSAILQFVEAVERQFMEAFNKAVENHEERKELDELHSFMLLRHGKVIAEGWWSPYGRDIPHMLFSLSKSFTSTAIGLAVAEGHFSLDDLVTTFFPDDLPAEVNEHLAAMQVRHLLSMSTGHADDTMPKMGGSADGNWTTAFFEVPVVHVPGTHFLYNTGATYMLSAILQKKTGEKLVDYLKPRLFEPLGIDYAVWEDSPQGISTGGFGLNIKTEAIARFGQLYLQKGQWEGRQLISEAWVDEATSFQIANDGNTIDWQQGYGYQFWRCTHNAYRGDGAFGQYCIVMPEQDAVLAITAGAADMQVPLDLVWKYLLPAMGAETLPDDAAAQASLTKKLSDLKFYPVAGQAASNLSARIDGRVYKLDSNELNFESISVNSNESGWMVSIKKAAVEERIPCGYLDWQAGQITLFNDAWEVEPAAITSSGAWTNDTFIMRVRFYRTPFFQTFFCHFAEDRLTIETKVNVGFAPPQTQVIVGHLA